MFRNLRASTSLCVFVLQTYHFGISSVPLGCVPSDPDAISQLQNMVKALREELAAERELRDGQQRRAHSLQVGTG